MAGVRLDINAIREAVQKNAKTLQEKKDQLHKEIAELSKSGSTKGVSSKTTEQEITAGEQKIWQKLLDKLPADKTNAALTETKTPNSNSLFQPATLVQALTQAYEESCAFILKHQNNSHALQTRKTVATTGGAHVVDLLLGKKIESFIAEGNGTASHKLLLELKQAAINFEISINKQLAAKQREASKDAQAAQNQFEKEMGGMELRDISTVRFSNSGN